MAMIVDVAGLMKMSQKELDDLYRKSTAGAIPVGDTIGTAYFAPGTGLCGVAAWLTRLLFWKGKVFNSEKKELLNKVSPVGFQAVPAKVYPGESWLDQGNTIVIDYSQSWFVARMIRDEIREVAPGLYLGKVFWGRKHVLDFTLMAKAVGH
jgi:hypothetical protein